MYNSSFQGSRLRLVRIFHGLSLADLGEQVSASRQYMQRLESDPETAPSREMLEALCVILHVDLQFFFEPIRNEVHEEECHFRKLNSTPLNLRTRALSYGTLLNIIISYLETKLDLPKLNIPSIDVDSRNDIEIAAEKCRDHWGLFIDAPIHNTTRTLEGNGCIVTTFYGVSEKIDAFSYFRNRPIIVRNMDKKSTSRSRFDLAHELGHIVMHINKEVGSPKLEEQANQFASAFLLPRAIFIRDFPKSKRFNWNELFKIKLRWGVSLQAIIRRAYDLRLINALQYRNANIHISRNHWRKAEPPETEPEAEPMEILPTSFDLLKQHYDLMPYDISNKIKLKCLFLEKFGISCTIPEQKPDRSIDISVDDHPMKRIKFHFN